MFENHMKTIEKALKKIEVNQNILAVILGGSIAHGFESENSDVDLMLVVSEDYYDKAFLSGDLHYFDKESADYEGGYVEGKYITKSFIRSVIEKGTEPARFAFKDAVILYSKLDDLEDLILKASAYPIENKYENMEKFHAQLEAWTWFYSEGLKKNDSYIINYAVTNICLFSGRLILAYNELVYPFHKWFLKVLSLAEKKPENIVGLINAALLTKDEKDVKNLVDAIQKFSHWPKYEHGWPVRFLLDSEINWLSGPAPVQDI